MKFAFEADMSRGECYRCPLWQEDYDENNGWTEYCKLDSLSDASDDLSCCPLEEIKTIKCL